MFVVLICPHAFKRNANAAVNSFYENFWKFQPFGFDLPPNVNPLPLLPGSDSDMTRLPSIPALRRGP